MLPLVGQILCRSKESAYRYLPESVLEFPDGEALAAKLRAHGLVDVKYDPLTFGIATLYVGVKPAGAVPCRLPRQTVSCMADAFVETIFSSGPPAASRSSGRRSGRCARPGRWDPEFNKVRAGQSFYEFSEDVESGRAGVALPAALRRRRDHPLLRHHHAPVAMGLPFELKPGAGPVPDRPIRTLADLDRLNANPDPATYSPHPHSC